MEIFFAYDTILFKVWRNFNGWNGKNVKNRNNWLGNGWRTDKKVV